MRWGEKPLWEQEKVKLERVQRSWIMKVGGGWKSGQLCVWNGLGELDTTDRSVVIEKLWKTS